MNFNRNFRFKKLVNYFICMIFFLSLSESYAKSEITDIGGKYRKYKFISMEVTKIVKSKLLSRESVYQGKIYIGTSKFRWDVEEPEKTQIIFDGKYIWNIQYPLKNIPGKILVAKMKLDKNTKKHILISTLISKDGISKNFKVLKITKENSYTKYMLSPTSKELNIKNLEIEIESNKISKISYLDDIGNSTFLTFKNTQFSLKASNKMFEYNPPKDSQVTNI